MMKCIHLSRKLFLGAVSAIALFWAACSVDSSDASDEDDINPVGRVVSPDDDKQKEEKKVEKDSSVVESDDDEMAAPTKLSVVRLAPSIWELEVDYTGKDGKKFVIQRMAPKDTKWKDIDSMSVDVHHKLLDGASNSGFYYRVAAMNGKNRSAYAPEIWIDEGVPYKEGLSLEAPTVTPNILQDSVLELVITGNYPSSNMINSIYNKDSKGKTVGYVAYQARFVYGDDYNVDTVKFSIDKASLSKKFKSSKDQCNSFAQVRVVWMDKNSVKDYSDWTSPMGTKTGTTDGLVNTNERCGDKNQLSSGEFVLPAPSDIAATQMENGEWVLSWKYTPSADRPEKGFRVQKLNLAEKKWENYESTSAGVYHLKLKNISEAYSYFRVCAFVDKENSEFSEDILVSVKTAEEGGEGGDNGEGGGKGATTVAPPSDFKIVRIAPSVWELSWKYESQFNDPNLFFVLQKSIYDEKENKLKWDDAGVEISSDARVFLVQGSENMDSYYRMAVSNGTDVSMFTPVVQLTSGVKYRDDVDLETPEFKMYVTYGYSKAFELDGKPETVDSVIASASTEYLMNSKYINKNIYLSKFTDTVYYEARWFAAMEYDQYYNWDIRSKVFHGMEKDNVKNYERNNYRESWIEPYRYEQPSIALRFDGRDTILVDNEKTTAYDYCVSRTKYKESEHSLVKGETPDEKVLEKELNMASCLNSYASLLCNFSIQMRVVWKDKFGEVDYSEWTAPTGIRDNDAAKSLCGN